MFDINFSDSKPIYKQVVEQVLLSIKQGRLRPGDRLPTERELAASLDIARGTVKKAYKELADNNIIEIRQGSGSYVFSEGDSYNMEYRRLAIKMMDELIDKLFVWEMSQKEISALFRMSMVKKDQSHRAARIAVVDCNPETLSLFKGQLGYIPGVNLSLIMVDSVLLDDNPGQLLSGYDMVLTTVTHYEQVSQSLKGLDMRILPVDMSPSRQTIVSLSTLPEGADIGIICRSNKFSYLVCEQLELFGGVRGRVPVHFETDALGSIKFMKKHRIIITAPDMLLLSPELGGGAVEEYTARGGRIIPFDYHIDRASLIHVEEHVDGILRSRE